MENNLTQDWPAPGASQSISPVESRGSDGINDWPAPGKKTTLWRKFKSFFAPEENKIDEFGDEVTPAPAKPIEQPVQSPIQNKVIAPPINIAPVNPSQVPQQQTQGGVLTSAKQRLITQASQMNALIALNVGMNSEVKPLESIKKIEEPKGFLDRNLEDTKMRIKAAIGGIEATGMAATGVISFVGGLLAGAGSLVAEGAKGKSLEESGRKAGEVKAKVEEFINNAAMNIIPLNEYGEAGVELINLPFERIYNDKVKIAQAAVDAVSKVKPEAAPYVGALVDASIEALTLKAMGDVGRVFGTKGKFEVPKKPIKGIEVGDIKTQYAEMKGKQGVFKDTEIPEGGVTKWPEPEKPQPPAQRTSVNIPETEIPEGKVIKNITEEMPIKEATNAVEKGNVEEGNLGEYRGVDEIREATETSGGDLNVKGREVKPEVKEIIPEIKSVTEQAKELGLEAKKWPDMDMYTILDPQTKGNFEVKPGDVVSEKLAKHREKFETEIETNEKNTVKNTSNLEMVEEEPKEIVKPFYSKLHKVVNEDIKEMPSKSQSVINWLEKKGVKPMEVEELGVKKWLEENQKEGKFDKEGLRKFVEENQIAIEEVTKENKWVDYTKIYDLEGERNKLINKENGVRTPAENKRIEDINKEIERLENEAAEIENSYTKFEEYKLEGGENYKEILFKKKYPKNIQELVDKKNNIIKEQDELRKELDRINWQDEDKVKKFDHINTYINKINEQIPREYKSPHWDEPNVLGHVRMQDLVDTEGKKVLLIEEIQSDWHQAGKKFGYGNQKQFNAYYTTEDGTIIHLASATSEKEALRLGSEEAKRIHYKGNIKVKEQIPSYIKGVPNAPLKQNWHEYLMKRMLRYGAENGYDRVAWTEGKTQAERYDLSKQIDHIEYVNDGKNTTLSIFDNENTLPLETRVIKNTELENWLGKEVASKIVNNEGKVLNDANNKPYHVLENVDLKIGGEGMKSFYDEKLPGFMNKYVKQWEGKVGETFIEVPKEKYPAVEYRGPEYTIEELKTFLNDHPDLTLYERRPIESIIREMEAGTSFTASINFDGTPIVAELLGGKVVELPRNLEQVKLHSIDITPQMRESVMYQGQTLYSDPLGFHVILDKLGEGNKAFHEYAQYAKEAKIIVKEYNPYDFGDALPERRSANIPTDAPVLRSDKDMSRYVQELSPHTAMRGNFDLYNDPVIDMIKARMKYLSTVKDSITYAKHALKDIPNDSKMIQKTIKPLFDKHEELFTRYNEIRDDLIHQQRLLSKIPEHSAFEKINSEVTKLTKQLKRAQEKLEKYTGPQALEKFLDDKKKAIDTYEAKIASLKNEKNKNVQEGYFKAIQRVKDKKLESEVKKVESVIRKLNKMIDTRLEKSNKLRDEYTQIKSYQEIQTKIKELRNKEKEMAPEFEPLTKEFDKLYLDLQKKSSNVRVFAKADGTLDPSVKLTPKEERAANMIKAYMEQTKTELEELKIPVIKSSSYMTHLIRPLIEGSEIIPFTKVKSKPTLLRFISRMPESRPWFPSAHAVMEAYVPMAEYRLAYQPFLHRWRPFVDKLQKPILRNYMERWLDANLKNQGTSSWDTALNAATAFEYARTIGLSVSVGVKHGVKVLGTPAEYGMTSTLQGMPHVMMLPGQVGTSLVKAHFPTFAKALNKMGIKGENDQLRIFRAYVMTGDIIRMMSEIPGIQSMDRMWLEQNAGKTIKGVAAVANRMIKNAISQPVKTVELIDNGASVMAGIIAGMKKNISPMLIDRKIIETILDVNFRSGPDQPLYQKKTLPRALSMFQQTPQKLVERLGKWGSDAFSISKDANGKIQIGKRDAYGTHGGAKLLRFLMYVGVAETIARQNGTSLLGITVAHVPFFGEVIEPTSDFPFYEFKKPHFVTSPILQDAYDMAKSGPYATIADRITDFNLVSKIERAEEGWYPTSYDSALKYMLGLRRVGSSFENYAQEIASKKIYGMQSESSKTKTMLRLQYDRGVIDKTDLSEAVRNKDITPLDKDNIIKWSKLDPAEREAKRLTIEELIEGAKHANEYELKSIKPILKNKIFNAWSRGMIKREKYEEYKDALEDL